MHLKRLAGAACALTLVLGVAACSDDGDSAKTPDKATYLKDADAICKKSNDEINANSKKLDVKDKAAYDRFLKESSTRTLESISDVRDLGYPKGDQAKLEGWWDTVDKTFKALEADPSKADDDSFGKELEKITTEMKAYGFKECGQN